MRLIYFTLVTGLLLTACGRTETAPPPAQSTPAADSATVQDLSSVDTKLTIVPVRPVFVRSVDLLQNGQAVPEGSAPLPKAQRFELVIALQNSPGGLGLRYEIADGDKTLLEERKVLETSTTEVRYLLPLQSLPSGKYELRLWSGADLVERRQLSVS